MITYHGETFEDYNRPKATPDHPSKSHVVLAKHKGIVRMIRFGQQGVKGSPKKEGESEAYRARRDAWYARHRKNIAKGPLHPAWWAAKVNPAPHPHRLRGIPPKPLPFFSIKPGTKFLGF
jgi:hypothetical protein